MTGSPECLWCREPDGRVLAESPLFFAVLDAYPVNRGHALVISRRHISDLFGLEAADFAELHAILARLRKALDAEFCPDGYNVGANCGAAAGQTIFHFHLHVIPRYTNDVANPRGGIRNLKEPLSPY